jgi:hypothetical protein
MYIETMSRKPDDLQEWRHRIERMKQCGTAAELLAQHGEPAHKDRSSSMDIWHYPLGIAKGTLYSIHAAVMQDQLLHVYMHLEPIGDTASNPPKRPWWELLRAPLKV